MIIFIYRSNIDLIFKGMSYVIKDIVFRMINSFNSYKCCIILFVYLFFLIYIRVKWNLFHYSFELMACLDNWVNNFIFRSNVILRSYSYYQFIINLL